MSADVVVFCPCVVEVPRSAVVMAWPVELSRAHHFYTTVASRSADIGHVERQAVAAGWSGVVRVQPVESHASDLFVGFGSAGVWLMPRDGRYVPLGAEARLPEFWRALAAADGLERL